jgi:hypothetical protein
MTSDLDHNSVSLFYRERYAYVCLFVCLLCVCSSEPLATLEPVDGFLLDLLLLLYH